MWLGMAFCSHMCFIDDSKLWSFNFIWICFPYVENSFFFPYSLYCLRLDFIGVFYATQYIIIVAQYLLSKGQIGSMYNNPSLVIIWQVYKRIIISFKLSYNHTIIGTVL